MTYIKLFRKHIFTCFHDTLTQITCQVEAIQCFFFTELFGIEFFICSSVTVCQRRARWVSPWEGLFGNKNKFMPIILDVKDYIDCSQVLLCPLFCLNFPSTRSNIKCFLEERQKAKIDPMQYDRPHDQWGRQSKGAWNFSTFVKKLFSVFQWFSDFQCNQKCSSTLESLKSSIYIFFILSIKGL